MKRIMFLLLIALALTAAIVVPVFGADTQQGPPALIDDQPASTVPVVMSVSISPLLAVAIAISSIGSLIALAIIAALAVLVHKGQFGLMINGQALWNALLQRFGPPGGTEEKRSMKRKKTGKSTEKTKPKRARIGPEKEAEQKPEN